MKLHNVLIRPTDLFEEILRRKLISGGGPSYIIKTITGNLPITVTDAISSKLVSLTQYGKCEQASTPSPSSPVDVYCNNGALKMVDDELPNGYKRILGLTFNNNVYYAITGFKMRGSDTLRFSFKCSMSTPACNVLGAYDGSSLQSNYSLYLGNSASAKYLRYNGNGYRSDADSDTQYDVVITPTGSIGMKSDSVWTEKTFESNSDLCIGTTSPTATSSKMVGDIIGNVIVDGRLKLIPCERVSDNTLGYYDTISEVFYEPTGTGVVSMGYDGSHYSLAVNGTPEVLTVCGKNLCPNKSYTVNNNSTQIGSDDANAYPFYFVGGTAYTISYTATKAMKVFLRKDTDQGGTLQGESQTSVSFTPSESGWYRIVLNNASGYASANVTNIQIEVGSSATDYEAYSEQTASVETLYAVGDYKDEQNIVSGVVTRACGIKVLDGTENWTRTSSGSGFTVFSIEDNAHAIQGWNEITSLCTNFECYVGDTSPTYIADNAGKFWLNTAGQYFRFVTDGTMNLAQFKAFLAAQYANGTPVIVIYPLAEETTDTATAQRLSFAEGSNTVSATAEVSDITAQIEYKAQAE